MFATSLDLCSWQQDSNFSTSAVVNSSSFHYGYVTLYIKLHIVLLNVHSYICVYVYISNI